MKLEIFQGKDAQWYFQLVANNGHVAMVSEGYTQKSTAHRALKKAAQEIFAPEGAVSRFDREDPELDRDCNGQFLKPGT